MTIHDYFVLVYYFCNMDSLMRDLYFAKITILKPSLAEVEIKEGVVINPYMVSVYHDFLLNNLTAPFSLLINKKNKYTYTETTQKQIANLPEIKSMAVVTYDDKSLRTTQTLIRTPRVKDWHIKLFKDRDSALHWLSFECYKAASDELQCYLQHRNNYTLEERKIIRDSLKNRVLDCGSILKIKTE